MSSAQFWDWGNVCMIWIVLAQPQGGTKFIRLLLCALLQPQLGITSPAWKDNWMSRYNFTDLVVQEVDSHKQTPYFGKWLCESPTARKRTQKRLDKVYVHLYYSHQYNTRSLVSYISRRRPRDINPGLGKVCTGAQHEGNVDHSVDRVFNHMAQRFWWREVVAEARDWVGAHGSICCWPHTQEADKDVACETRGEHLRDDVQVADQGTLQNDGNVGGVEELDRVGGALATVASRLDGQVHTETLRQQLIRCPNKEQNKTWNSHYIVEQV